MTALVAESYVRAYSAAVRLQQLVELEEIIAVRMLEAQNSSEVRSIISVDDVYGFYFSRVKVIM